MDWASFGYLMTAEQICSPSTLDISYTYRVNNPNIYLRYFGAIKDIPTKIIYIDYGRDEQLSIDEDEWAFNKFVNGFYVCRDEYISEIFNVKVYVLRNRMKAIEYIDEISRNNKQ